MKAWYEESFGRDYLLVYKHRDFAGACAEVRTMIGWLGLSPGAAVLDLCCGMGRHSMALADEGYRVTGMDLSGTLLQEAKRLDGGQRVDWRQGDMRELPFARGSFDAVMNLFTSFGYFEDDKENTLVLKEIDRVLKPGGRFVIDFLNAAYIRDRLVPYSVRTDAELGLTIEETRAVEDGFVRKRIVVKEENQENRQYMEQVKLYGFADFRRMLDEAGLKLDAVHGGYDGQPFDSELSPRLILIGTKTTQEKDEV